MRHLLLATALLTGCAAIDRPAQSRFEPTREADGTRSFKYEVLESVFWKDADGISDEHKRWLDLYIAENRYCATGYTLTGKDIVNVEMPLGTTKRLYFTGRCK